MIVVNTYKSSFIHWRVQLLSALDNNEVSCYWVASLPLMVYIMFEFWNSGSSSRVVRLAFDDVIG